MGRSGQAAVVAAFLLTTACPADPPGERVGVAKTFHDLTPHYSPDGNKIVFSSDRAGNEDIWVMDADGSNPRQLTEGPAVDLDPKFSPDGNEIVYTSNLNAPIPHLWIVGIDGGAPAPVNEEPFGGAIFPDWSPDGSELVYACGRPFEYNVCKTDADGTNSEVILAGRRSNEWEAAWSPNGDKLAFVSNRDGDDDIYLATPEGTNLQKLTANPGRDADPAWSPDGNRIAFDSSRAGEDTTQLYVMNADGSGVEALTKREAGAVTPTWAPAGDRIAFAGHDGGSTVIYELTLESGRVRRLSTGP